jgi:hypothetical protein
MHVSHVRVWVVWTECDPAVELAREVYTTWMETAMAETKTSVNHQLIAETVCCPVQCHARFTCTCVGGVDGMRPRR